MPKFGADVFKRPKKQKQVKTSKGKLKELANLKAINKKIDAQRKADDKRFAKMDKLFKAKRKAEEKLGIS
jgi:hypothetical protein